ncbi:MAG: RlmE family RNA methyltransferase [Salinisphaera sp.]|nr:RlmE family RNA methyltransferase [Salinisphaera sp.]
MRKAQGAGYRSRAAFKLAQIDAAEHLLRPGMTVVDLGAAPGGWSQYCARGLQARGRIIALDCLPIQPITGVSVIEADFTDTAGLQALDAALDGAGADLVLSDLAPNLSGVAVVDQMNVMFLAEQVLAFCDGRLNRGGDLVFKLFRGEGFDDLVVRARAGFGKVSVRKPSASRDASREAYLVGRRWKG